MDQKELTVFRMLAGLTMKNAAQELKAQFPGMDKNLICKCESPQYGVCISGAAARVLKENHPDAAKKAAIAARKRKADRHKNTRRVSVRLTDEEFSRLQQHLKDACVTAQDALTRWIESEINSKKGETQNDAG